MTTTELTGDLFIDGAWTKGDGQPLRSENPATGGTLWTGTAAGRQQVDAALLAAHEAFRPWRRLSVSDRFAFIERYSKAAADHKEDIATLISRETGKALWDARTEAGAIAGKAAVAMKAYEERTPTRESGGTALTHRPHGVMAVIGPFNFPGHLPNGHIVPALIAGNTVVFKPSEKTPAVAEYLVRLWQDAGLPKGVINLVHGGAEAATQLVTDPLTSGVLFTGGVRAGVAIHRALAGDPDKLLALELGGNNPLVVWNAQDKVAAARIIIRSAFITTGQRCTCARRLIIQEGPEGDALVDALAGMIPQLIVGAPDSTPEPFMGPMVDAGAADAVITAQSQMVEEGATPIILAQKLDHGPSYLSPGLIDTTSWEARHDNEIFGPLLQIIRVPDFEAALIMANDTRFGLSASLLSDDEALWNTFRQEINAGLVNWNRQTTGASGSAPFGGPGLSGNNRPAGYYTADHCAWPMASVVESGPLKDEAALPGLKS